MKVEELFAEDAAMTTVSHLPATPFVRPKKKKKKKKKEELTK